MTSNDVTILIQPRSFVTNVAQCMYERADNMEVLAAECCSISCPKTYKTSLIP